MRQRQAGLDPKQRAKATAAFLRRLVAQVVDDEDWAVGFAGQLVRNRPIQEP